MNRRIFEGMGVNKSKKPWGVVIGTLLFLMVISYLLYFILLHHQGVVPKPFDPVTKIYNQELITADFKRLSDDKRVSLSSYKGDWLLVNLWATWCAPCIKELPSLEEFNNKGIEEIKVVAISLDKFIDEEEVQQFIKKKAKIKDLPLYFDDKKRVSRITNPKGLPLTLLINPYGHVIGEYSGDYDWSEFDTSFIK